MKIVYDEARAVERKDRLDCDNAQNWARVKKWDTLSNLFKAMALIGFALILLCGLVGSLSFFINPLEEFLVSLDDSAAGMVIVRAFVGLALLTILLLITAWFVGRRVGDNKPSLDFDDYPMDVKYLLLTQGKTVLSLRVVNDNRMLIVTLEDKDHVVTEEEIPFRFPPQIRTDVADVTAGLATSTVYVPYAATVANA